MNLCLRSEETRWWDSVLASYWEHVLIAGDLNQAAVSTLSALPEQNRQTSSLEALNFQ